MLKSPSWKAHHPPCPQGVCILQIFKHIIGEVFMLTHKLFNLHFAEEIRILETLNQLCMWKPQFGTSWRNFLNPICLHVSLFSYLLHSAEDLYLQCWKHMFIWWVTECLGNGMFLRLAAGWWGSTSMFLP